MDPLLRNNCVRHDLDMMYNTYIIFNFVRVIYVHYVRQMTSKCLLQSDWCAKILAHGSKMV